MNIKEYININIENEGLKTLIKEAWEGKEDKNWAEIRGVEVEGSPMNADAYAMKVAEAVKHYILDFNFLGKYTQIARTYLDTVVGAALLGDMYMPTDRVADVSDLVKARAELTARAEELEIPGGIISGVFTLIETQLGSDTPEPINKASGINPTNGVPIYPNWILAFAIDRVENN